MTVSRQARVFQPARTLRLAAVDDPEFARVLRTGDCASALDGALIFQPPAAAAWTEWLQRWQEWQDGVFAQKLVPLLASVMGRAAQGQAREIISLDAELDAALEPASRVRSAAAGQRLLARLNGAQGDRWLGKLQIACTEKHFAAHFLTIHACQSALFHLPLRLLPPSYAYWEWCAALTECPPADATAAPHFDAATPALRRWAETLPLSADAAAAACTIRVS